VSALPRSMRSVSNASRRRLPGLLSRPWHVRGRSREGTTLVFSWKSRREALSSWADQLVWKEQGAWNLSCMPMWCQRLPRISDASALVSEGSPHISKVRVFIGSSRTLWHRVATSPTVTELVVVRSMAESLQMRALRGVMTERVYSRWQILGRTRTTRNFLSCSKPLPGLTASTLSLVSLWETCRCCG